MSKTSCAVETYTTDSVFEVKYYLVTKCNHSYPNVIKVTKYVVLNDLEIEKNRFIVHGVVNNECLTRIRKLLFKTFDRNEYDLCVDCVTEVESFSERCFDGD